MEMRVCWDISQKIDCDVMVVGAGPAGIASALASARKGADTVLVERYGCVGGMATAGLVGPFMTSYSVDGRHSIVEGIYRELIERMEKEGGAIPPENVQAGSDHVSFITRAHHNCTPFDPEVLKYVALEMLLEAGVRVRFHSFFVDTLTSENAIENIVFADKSGLGLGRARVFVDTTGDADVAARAGNGYYKGAENSGKMQPATLFMRVASVDDEAVREWKLKHPEERLFESLVSRARSEGNWDLPRNAVGLYRQPRRGEWRVNTGRILDIDGTDPEALTKAEIEGRKQAVQIMNFFRNYCPGFETAHLVDTGFQVGIRETRRIKGHYTLTSQDVKDAMQFEDAIARYSFFMDVHNPEGSGQESGEWGEQIAGGDYFEIPYRCLIPDTTENLLVAGRAIASDHQANGAVRVMPCCFATGQAAGTAAFLASRENSAPLKIDGSELRKTLREDGCFV